MFISLRRVRQPQTLLLGALHLAALPDQAAFVVASFSEASDHIHHLAYVEVVVGSGASGVDWNHKDLVERYKHLASCAQVAEGTPSVQVGQERQT